MWFLDANFIELIRSWWQQDNIKGSKMFKFVSKMKMLKSKILEWNREHFNNIFKEKLNNEENLNTLNAEVISNGMTNENFLLEKELLAKQEEILAKEVF